MKTLIAKKIGMTQIYDEYSKSLGVTVLDVSDCRVVQVKNNEKDGYSAVQLLSLIHISEPTRPY